MPVSSQTAPRHGSSSTKPAARRSQEMRSAATQQVVLNATLDCIMEKGLRDTSTVDIARRAGVSRGALLHHYPSKDKLLQEALRHLLTNEIFDIEQMARDVEEGRVGFDHFLDTLWEHFSGRMFMISLEFVTAARTDPRISEVLKDVALEFNDALDRIWVKLMLGSEIQPKKRRLALNATLCFLRGMGTQTIWRDDPELFKDMLDYWKDALTDAGIITERRGE